MLQSRPFTLVLIALVSIPGFLVGHKLRTGDHTTALLILPIMMMIVMVASALMRPSSD